MPKIVDHDERRREIAEVVLAIIARHGVAGVTLNNVAEESGWSRGVLSHYFTNKDHLLEAGLRQGMRTISTNIDEAATDPDARNALRRVLEEVLPLDERRLAFARVYVAFLAEAIVTEHLRHYFTYNHEAWRTVLETLLQRGESEQTWRLAESPSTLSSRLGALTEGLRMRALIDPALTPSAQRAQLDAWVDDWLDR